MALRIVCGAVGLAILVGTAVLALNLLVMEYDVSVLLAGYMAIGGILLGVYLLFYAITGAWRPNLTGRKSEP
ncbi:MAG: hypothetical protein KJP08_09545 [Gammaproteobacteria bacterium]|nr:hypothetical protein [Gammaproteobacteria bacterium]NNF50288.1 hypothetical protein [Woeseiaceae bacterium]